MALIRVDLPEPFGPRIATCSPRAIWRVRFRLMTLSPRIRVTPAKSMRRGEATDFLTTDGHGLTRIKIGRIRKPPNSKGGGARPPGGLVDASSENLPGGQVPPYRTPTKKPLHSPPATVCLPPHFPERWPSG